MAAEPILVVVPQENVNDETVKIVKWLAADGAKISAGQAAVEIETSKAVLEIVAPEAGYLRTLGAEGAEIAVGGPIFYITAGAKDPLPKAAAKKKSSDVDSSARFSEKARALIEKHGIAASAFTGKGLVRESDIVEYLARAGNPAGAQSAGAQSSGAATTREALPRRKLTEIRYLGAGQNGALASSVSVLCQTKGLRKIAAEKSEWGASLVPVLISETAKLLKKHPDFNAYFDDGAICRYSAVNVGVAIDADKGLKVPVFKDADKKSAGDLAREFQDKILLYLNDELDPADLSDGTFTISDLSGEGAFSVSPLINYRQAAILAVGAEIFPPGMFTLTLTFDHRLAEGRAAAAFLRALRDRLKIIEDKG